MSNFLHLDRPNTTAVVSVQSRRDEFIQSQNYFFLGFLLFMLTIVVLVGLMSFKAYKVALDKRAEQDLKRENEELKEKLAVAAVTSAVPAADIAPPRMPATQPVRSTEATSKPAVPVFSAAPVVSAQPVPSVAGLNAGQATSPYASEMAPEDEEEVPLMTPVFYSADHQPLRLTPEEIAAEAELERLCNEQDAAAAAHHHHD